MPLQLPSRYQLGRELGRGGMGIVYEADDERLGRKVAVKVLHAGQASEERKRRFAQEARAASALNHPNIITIHDIDAHDGVDFIVMELVDGVALTRVVRRRAAAARSRARLRAADCRRARRVARHQHRPPRHQAGEHHGDRCRARSRCSTSACRNGQPPPALMRRPSPPATRAGAIVGTSGYMAPEQALGQPIDARSDVFSFGAVLYELLAGKRAFGGDSEWAVTTAVVRDGPEPLSEIRPTCPTRCGGSSIAVSKRIESGAIRRPWKCSRICGGWRRARPDGAAPAPTAPDTSPRPPSRFSQSCSSAPGSRCAAGKRRRWSSDRFLKSSGWPPPDIHRRVQARSACDAGRARRSARAACAHRRRQSRDNHGTGRRRRCYFKDYVDVDGAWELVGRVPLKDVRVPQGQLRWKIVKDRLRLG